MSDQTIKLRVSRIVRGKWVEATYLVVGCIEGETIPSRIKRYREACGMTCRQFENSAGLGHTTVNKIEDGTISGDERQIGDIARSFGITLDELLASHVNDAIKTWDGQPSPRMTGPPNKTPSSMCPGVAYLALVCAREAAKLTLSLDLLKGRIETAQALDHNHAYQSDLLRLIADIIDAREQIDRMGA